MAGRLGSRPSSSLATGCTRAAADDHHRLPSSSPGPVPCAAYARAPADHTTRNTTSTKVENDRARTTSSCVSQLKVTPHRGHSQHQVSALCTHQRPKNSCGVVSPSAPASHLVDRPAGRRAAMSSSTQLSGSWSSAAERIGLHLQGRRPILQALGRRSVSAAAAVMADDERAAGGGGGGGGVRAGAVPPPRHHASSDEPAAAAAATATASPTRSGTGGAAGSPGDGDDGALLGAAAPSPPPGLSTAEFALSILVDCFGH
ncbi:hypothetical protein SORBI_3002G017750 [Sorghum bicolor]|uniref:Uncharacterized protein n=1 Tax=Sorghum bicolor TaxID=4558 RepID=A0A1W0W1W4_SORBI|nr:hypothetical protein SORBI_3002G017750 [Sorghum bicolor]